MKENTFIIINKPQANISSGFISSDDPKVNKEIQKAHVKAHTRKTKSGKLVNVKEHEDKRKKHEEKSNNKDTIESLTEEYQKFLKNNSLPKESADDLLHDKVKNKLNKEQIDYLNKFIERWDKAQDEDSEEVNDRDKKGTDINGKKIEKNNFVKYYDSDLGTYKIGKVEEIDVENNKVKLYIGKDKYKNFHSKDMTVISNEEAGSFAKLNKEEKEEELSDDDNPKFLFSGINTKLLTSILKDKVSLEKLLRTELANRGLDSEGKWIGFKQAKEHHKI